LTSRLGATIDVEQNHVRFLGGLILNLWDCGGQDAFMDSYLSTQRATIFQHVGVLIYVFDVGAHERAQDPEYFRDCLDALRRYSPNAHVFLLLHKMDLVAASERPALITRRRAELESESAGQGISATVFGTSIYDESLYKVRRRILRASAACLELKLWLAWQAWSRIVHAIIPNAAILTKHLTTFAEACSATEVILFERTTFLVIATSALQPPTFGAQFSHSRDVSASAGAQNGDATDGDAPSAAETLHALDGTRYERTSELIKALKHSCARLREEPAALEMELPECTAVLAEMTRNTYVLVIAHDPTIGAYALLVARDIFGLVVHP
jgi:Ras-related GTP-binding protein A/B